MLIRSGIMRRVYSRKYNAIFSSWGGVQVLIALIAVRSEVAADGLCSAEGEGEGLTR